MKICSQSKIKKKKQRMNPLSKWIMLPFMRKLTLWSQSSSKSNPSQMNRWVSHRTPLLEDLISKIKNPLSNRISNNNSRNNNKFLKNQMEKKMLSCNNCNSSKSLKSSNKQWFKNKCNKIRRSQNKAASITMKSI